MRNQLIILVLIFVLYQYNQTQLLSLPVNCNDCSEVSWSNPVNFTSPSCLGTLTYMTKFCNGCFYVKITFFSTTTATNDAAQFQNCMINELIKNNPMLFPPNTPADGEKEWRVVRNTCWTYQDPAKLIQVPCSNSENCCFTRLIVRKENNCGNIIKIVDENGDLTDCTPFGIGGNSCFDTCIPTKLPTPIKTNH